MSTTSLPEASEFLDETRLVRIGQVNAALLGEGNRWIHRRKESLRILDETALRRQVSVDFTLPEQQLQRSVPQGAAVKLPFGGEPVFCPPLFVLPKSDSNLMSFDLEDETGRSLPLMTRSDNARVSASTLVELASQVVARHGKSLSPGLEAVLTRLALTPRPAIVSALHGPDAADADAVALLRQDGPFMWWARTLAHSSIVVVPYRDPTIRRKIFKLSYQEPIATDLSIRGRLGWTPYQVVVDSSWVDARNYHLEAEAPPGLRIASATLTDDEHEPVSDEGFLRRVHLYQPGAARAGAATAVLKLRVSGQGFMGGAVIACGLVLGAVLAGLLRAKSIAENPTSAPALLLLLPALIASYVARPDQHALTTRLLSFARRLLLISGGVAYVLAAVVALGGKAPTDAAVGARTDVLRWWFGSGLVIAGLSSLVLAMGWLLAHPGFRRVASFGWAGPLLRRLTLRRFRYTSATPLSAQDLFVRIEASAEVLLGCDTGRSRRLIRDRQSHELAFVRFDRLATWLFNLRLVTAPDGSASLSVVGDCRMKVLAMPLLPLVVRSELVKRTERLDSFVADAT